MRATASVSVMGIIVLNVTKPYPGPKGLGAGFAEFAAMALWLIAIYLFWFLLFRHWKKARFLTRTLRWTWFWTILAGAFAMFVGPVLYYISVVEMGRTLAGNAAKGGES